MFESIHISFKDQELKVPATKVFGLIAEIEEHITISDLYSNPKNTAIAKAYSAAVRYAGGKASTSEVYEMLFDADGASNVRVVIESLMMMMIPPKHLRPDVENSGDSEKKAMPD